MTEKLDVFHIGYHKARGTVCFAPYVQVRVHSGGRQGSSEPFQCRVDTGADITCIPREHTKGLLPILLGEKILIRGHTGKIAKSKGHLLVVTMFDEKTDETTSHRPKRGVLLTDSDIGLLGMDILKNYSILLDGVDSFMIKKYK